MSIYYRTDIAVFILTAELAYTGSFYDIAERLSEGAELWN